MVQEIASGMHDTRPKLLKLLTDPQIGKVVVEHRYRLTRFGFLYIEQLFAMQGRTLEVLFPRDSKHDLVADFSAVLTSMASRMYGRRHSKERAEKIKQCVGQVTKQEARTRTFHPDQARARLSELHEKRGQAIERRPDQRAHDGSRPFRLYG